MDIENMFHPSYHSSETGLNVLDVIEAFTFDLNGIEAVETANVIKYICGWKDKNGLADLKNAAKCLYDLIKHVEKIEKENINLGYTKPSKENNVKNYYLSVDSMEKAKNILNSLKIKIIDYGYATINDYYNLLGLESDAEDYFYGWTNLNDAEIKKINDNNYMVDLPNAYMLKN